MHCNGRLSVRRGWDSRIDSPHWPFCRSGQYMSLDLPTKHYPAGATRPHPVAQANYDLTSVSGYWCHCEAIRRRKAESYEYQYMTDG